MVPGSAFGVTDTCALRISFGALDRESVAAGMGRLVEASGGSRLSVRPRRAALEDVPGTDHGAQGAGASLATDDVASGCRSGCVARTRCR